MRAFLTRLSGWARRARHERGMQEELEAHFRMHIEDNVRAGMSEAHARREAVIRFGSVEGVKERMREMRTIEWMEGLRQDLQYCFRGIRKNKGFAATAIISMALGIGASVSIFTVADNLLLRPMPFHEASQLVMVWETRVTGKLKHNVVSPGNYLDWKSQSDVFETLAAFREARSVLSDGTRTEELDKQLMSAELLPMLGVKPVRGRWFNAEEDKPGDGTVVLISHRVWQQWFGGAEDIIGRKVQVNATPRTVIGVMPAGFSFRNRETDLWEPLGLNLAQDYRKTQGRWMLTVGRMKRGVTVQQTQTQMTALAQRLESTYPAFNKNWTVTVEPLRESMVREVKTSLVVLLCAVGLLLLVACANVANLLLARHAARVREFAVRASLGAGRSRVIRQLVTESVVLGVIGGALGLLVARWAVMGLVAISPREISRPLEIAVDLRIVAFALGLSVLTSLFFGMAPAWMTMRTQLTQALHENSRSSAGGRGHLRAWLVGAEVALSVMLLAGAGLMMRTLVGLQSVDPGLNASNLLTFRVSIPAAKYRELPSRTQFFAKVQERLTQLPGVRSASAVSYLPFTGLAAGTWVHFEGKPSAKPGEELVTVVRTVMPRYFQTMGIPLKKGRDFTESDNDATRPGRFVVNETFVRKFIPGEEPLGQRISVLMNSTNPFGEIIGVVGDVKEGSVDKAPEPTVYYVHANLIYTGMVFVVRTEGDHMVAADQARRIVREIDPAQPIAEVRTMNEVLGETMGRQRVSALLLAGFSITALLLAAVGIYGVLAYAVTERTREIGLRVALGAEQRQIVGMVVGKGLKLVVAGTVAGVAGALALTGLLKGLLYGVGPRDPLTFAVVPGLLMLVALVAAVMPARRAARVDPAVALRAE